MLTAPFATPILLWWHKELWLIDHGAALYFHHTWQDWENPERPFSKIKDHVLLPLATKLPEADAINRALIREDKIRSIINMIPDEWLSDEPAFHTPEEQREAYVKFLVNRISHSDFFVNEANHARESRI